MTVVDRAAAKEPNGPLGSDRLAARLGSLRGLPWPEPARLAGGTFAGLVHRARMLRISVDESPSEATAVRVAGAALRDGLRQLGLTDGANAGSEMRLRVANVDHLERLAQGGADGLKIIPLVVGLVPPSDLDAALARLSRFAFVGATDPVLVRLLLAQGAAAQLWSPIDLAHRGPQESAEDPLIAGLPRAARTELPDVDVWSERSLDVVSFGEESGERSALLGRSAALLARHACVIVHRRPLWRLADEPLLTESAARFVFRRAKIVLNIHAGEFSSLDWSLGTLDAMALGALAASTPCHPHPFLTKDVHYLEETSDRIPRLIEWLLDTPEGARTAEAVRSAAMMALTTEARTARMTANLLAGALAAMDARA